MTKVVGATVASLPPLEDQSKLIMPVAANAVQVEDAGDEVIPWRLSRRCSFKIRLSFPSR